MNKRFRPPPKKKSLILLVRRLIASISPLYWNRKINNWKHLFLPAILGFHSMMNQDQYHASLLNSGQPVGLGWDGVTKASQPKVYPMEPPNDTDVDATIKQVRNDDSSLTDLNWNNIKVSRLYFCEGNDAFHELTLVSCYRIFQTKNSCSCSKVWKWIHISSH